MYRQVFGIFLPNLGGCMGHLVALRNRNGCLVTVRVRNREITYLGKFSCTLGVRSGQFESVCVWNRSLVALGVRIGQHVSAGVRIVSVVVPTGHLLAVKVQEQFFCVCTYPDLLCM